MLPVKPAILLDQNQTTLPIYMTNAEFDWPSSYVGNVGFGLGQVINPKLVIKPNISSLSS